MRAHRLVLNVAMAIGTFAPLSGACAEEYRGTFEQQMACTPDVWRLCFDKIPDANRITACLRQNTPQLSDGCRSVFESNDSTQQSQPHGRAARPPS